MHVNHEYVQNAILPKEIGVVNYYGHSEEK